MSTTRNLRRTLVATLAIAATSMAVTPLHAQFGLSISIGATSQVPPPPLPIYEQPEAPGDGYIWTPGYWAWDDEVQDYFWVPGTWVMAPEPGLLWTPGYWGFDNGAYGFHDGYWGQHVGFYGGVNYGFGYFGSGYEGGYWNGNNFYYNTAVNRINRSFVRNTYDRPMRPEWNNRGPRYAFNGPGGVNVRPSRGEQQAFREHHFDATGFQRNQQSFARQDRGQFSNFNHGAPPAAATPRPVQNANGFRQGAAPAQGAPTNPPNFTRGNGFDRGNGGFNQNRPGGDNRGQDNRFNGDNRGNTPQATDPRTNGGNGMNYNGNGGRNGFNGQQGGRPTQPGQPAQPAQPAQPIQPAQPVQPNQPNQPNQGNPRGNFQPGDGRFRPQPANPPRMPMPQDNGNGNNRFNGGQPGQSQQPRQFQMTQPQPGQQPAQQQPQQRPAQQQPVPQQPVQQQQPMQQRPAVNQPAPNNPGSMRDQRGPGNANFRPR
ncbi:cell division protein [Terriglobus roseus DSM 18391]|uniref:Cell division protein n=1 Tax=Terriglobus roseus (strain DSM 18391 / NRRL B-41598 / KBS 63) TaxID=926566 RepID=I3ZK88_TERRK|nr:YXWGXW repeat-containing protein [Terriglobus roseus]AFL89656.1 cell division protein [Terriglobus roseus DSM 18391]